MIGEGTGFMGEINTVNAYDLRSLERSVGSMQNTVGRLPSLIESCCDEVERNINYKINSEIKSLSSEIWTIKSQVDTLNGQFSQFCHLQILANNRAHSNSQVSQLRQEIESKFGHYSKVRRATTGILQAADLGIVRTDSILSSSEELLIYTPDYWLAPCLMTLAAWIENDQDKAKRALNEAIKRDDEKTSLFFALVCRRAERHSAVLKWTQRYLANQDAEAVDQKTMAVIEAYALGLLGADSENVICGQLEAWLCKLRKNGNSIDEQREQWKAYIRKQRKTVSCQGYPYLHKYSRTWPVLENILAGASLHKTVADTYQQFLNRISHAGPVKQQLDELLTGLVSNYDYAEQELHKKEQYHKFVVDCGGDESIAKDKMRELEHVHEAKVDFAQLITNAVLHPEQAQVGVQTQKLAFAMSKDWIIEAYRDVVAEDRAKIPHQIQFSIDEFTGQTADGHNEGQTIIDFTNYIDKEMAEAISKEELPPQRFRHYNIKKYVAMFFAAACLIASIVRFFNDSWLLTTGGVISIIIALFILSDCQKFAKIEAQNELKLQQIRDDFAKRKENATAIIRSIMAEVVDFRTEFAQKDKESQTVLDFLGQISPSQYVLKQATSSRRVRV